MVVKFEVSILTMEPAEKGIDTAAEVKSSSSPSYCSPLAIASSAKTGSFLGAFSFITGSLLAGRVSSAASTALSSSATSLRATSSLKVGSFLSGLASCLGSLAELSSVSSAASSFASSTDSSLASSADSSLASSAESSLASSTDSSLASSLDSTAGLPAAPSSVDALLS